ncbi:MAG TPA: PAS domain S-box protein, partial [Pirellulales bacterium]|nr:PAS domain S-box protein [Pirellulales bacterium]
LVRFERQTRIDRAKTAAVDSPDPHRAEAVEAAGEDESSIRHLEEELRITREELQCTIEELETANEEFKAANEEVTSVNEELQSANEELETSKEELQSLNEELQTVNCQLEQKIGELEATNNDLSHFLASADMATIFLDRRFFMRRFTPATARLFRVIGSDAGRPIRDFARNFTDDDLLSDGERVLQNLIPVEKEVQDNERRWYLRRIVPYRTEDDRIDGVVITFADITRIKEAQQALKDFAAELERRVAQRTAELETANAALRKSDTRFRAMLDAAPDPAVVIDAAGKIALVNRRTEDLFGYTRAELIGQPVEMLFRESLRAQHRRDRTAFFESPNPQPTALGMQLSVRRKDASLLPVDAQLTPLEINQRPMAMETIRDISERKRLEQQIAEIAEQERQTLGRELHDTLGQQLSGLSMMAATLKEQVGNGSTHATAIANLSEVVEQTKQQLRGLAKGLVAIPIDAHGLRAALRDLAVEVTQFYKIECQFDCLDEVALDDDFAATQLFLIAREAANNAARHSQSRQIVIHLENQDGLRISVRDDGRGMPTKNGGSSGMGLRIMQHRCGLIAGTLKIEAAPGGGTIVSCHLNRERKGA